MGGVTGQRKSFRQCVRANQQAYRRRSESGKSKASFDLLECNEELLKLH